MRAWPTMNRELRLPRREAVVEKLPPELRHPQPRYSIGGKIFRKSALLGKGIGIAQIPKRDG